ncbi:unnamed protein product [Trichobilharzia regenti]|uniref:Prominin-1 n=1 Tax=Trichobilharzia regenti TaxID=157069 RepID=A0A183WSI6_TRIRE|nr:unnamed protein product [Trichobilharzia regenti]VDQ10969.1 unnamed protein product [Trichobilharzia regenti]
MDSIYSSANAIVSRAQPSLDGGIITFILNNLVHLPTPDSSSPSSSNQTTTTSDSEVTITHHILSTYSRTGYALGIVCAVLWSIILIIIACSTCRRRKHIKKHSETLIYLAPTDNHVLNTSRQTINTGSLTHHSSKSTFYRTRERLQSSWICLAIQFALLTLLAILLGTAVILGFTASGQLHTNLITTPIHEESVGRLLTIGELDITNPDKRHIFPRLLRGLAQIRAYISEFVPQTKIDIEPIVKELIQATEKMQDRMTNEFNAILFNDIGVTEAFQLGDILGGHVVTLINKYTAIVESNKEFKNIFDRLKVEFQSWLRLVNADSPQNDYNCVDQCSVLRSTFMNNVSVRPDSFMPEINFAIALKFLTTDRNQTAESIQAQLNHGKELANQQLERTKSMMAEKINIPESIRNMTNKQWDQIGSQLSDVLSRIDQIFIMITRSISPKVSSASSLFLTLNLIFWFSILLITIGLIWLIIRYHFVPAELGLQARNRVRLGASVGYFILAISIILACLFYLIGGYLYTEGCRYINPEQNMINVTDYDPTHQNYIQKTMLPVDAHINAFINRNWPAIVSISSQLSSMPVPHIRSPIYGILHNCRDNQGILQAMDSIKDFDMKALNDPQMSERFVNLGKEIMINSLESINVDEMFPKETDDNLAMASRLDDFIVNYEEVRLQLPKYYLSIQSPTDEAGNFTLWSVDDMWKAWEMYYTDILSYRLSVEQMNKLNSATEKVRRTLIQLDSIIKDIDENLIVLSSLKKSAPLVMKLQNRLIDLKAIMNNKTHLIHRAVQLFDENIKAKTPEEAMNLIVEYGPKIMSKVGQCRRVYSAVDDVNNAVCNGFVSVLNGFWFLMGWVTLIGTLIITFSLLLLMHKPQFNQASDKAYRRNIMNRKAIKSNTTTATTVTENCCSHPSELEALTTSHSPVIKSNPSEV